MPLAGEGEERYVSTTLVPIVLRILADLKGLTLHGEGLQRAAPVHFLGHNMYPDLAVMHYATRVVAVEVKYVDFANAKGALSTAIGQTVTYSRAGYLSSVALLIGPHHRETASEIQKENDQLKTDGAPWRICSPILTLA
jgi:hypothetical protein